MVLWSKQQEALEGVPLMERNSPSSSSFQVSVPWLCLSLPSLHPHPQNPGCFRPQEATKVTERPCATSWLLPAG